MGGVHATFTTESMSYTENTSLQQPLGKRHGTNQRAMIQFHPFKKKKTCWRRFPCRIRCGLKMHCETFLFESPSNAFLCGDVIALSGKFHSMTDWRLVSCDLDSSQT
ncbi:hypothetical protein NL108_013725 [Boleophthalmus pectinirostris]|nr:hypothetical protein NL108_013725 [Boleophthalmus pectinirostris]